MGFDYEVQFKPTAKHANADALSRLPLPFTVASFDEDYTVVRALHLEQFDSLPIDFKSIESATLADCSSVQQLRKVIGYVKFGWPNSSSHDSVVRPYFAKQNDMAVEGSALLCGLRVVIPKQLRKDVLNLLHECHPGIVRMKSLARQHVWWPGIDDDRTNGSQL